MEVCSPYFDPEYENLDDEIYGPRVSVDNESCDTCTVVKVDSLSKQGLLLNAVQALTDMDLFITKSYISSDAGWFMDVFHVKDPLGNKVTDGNVVRYIEQAIGQREELQSSPPDEKNNDNVSGVEFSTNCMAIEMIGINRPGLFSEISAALAEQKCNVIEVHASSYNDRLACIAYVSHESTSAFIDDPNRLSTIEDHLSNILGSSMNGNDDNRSARTCFLGCDNKMSHADRRLHQLILANPDFDRSQGHLYLPSMSVKMDNYIDERKTVVSIDQCNEKGYTVVNVECFDRPKLMFDTVCTLTDMQYVVFHAKIASRGPFAHQEYFIKNKDGSSLDTELEAKRVAKCLETTIESRVCKRAEQSLKAYFGGETSLCGFSPPKQALNGICLEIDLENSIGVVAYVTRILREHGLTITRADIASHGETTKSVLCIQDISGKKVDMEEVESVKKEMKPLALQVRNEMMPHKYSSTERDRLSLVTLLWSQLEKISHNFIS